MLAVCFLICVLLQQEGYLGRVFVGKVKGQSQVFLNRRQIKPAQYADQIYVVIAEGINVLQVRIAAEKLMIQPAARAKSMQTDMRRSSSSKGL